jgi:hypothetical protein
MAPDTRIETVSALPRNIWLVPGSRVLVHCVDAAIRKVNAPVTDFLNRHYTA